MNVTAGSQHLNCADSASNANEECTAFRVCAYEHEQDEKKGCMDWILKEEKKSYIISYVTICMFL